MTAVYVAVAGGLGVLARYGLTLASASIWTIAAVNVAGCFALGALSTAGGDVRAIAGAGFLGGFTTFSTFGVQAIESPPGTATAYVLVSVLGGLAAAALGRSLA